jgi:hypothetical protein
MSLPVPCSCNVPFGQFVGFKKSHEWNEDGKMIEATFYDFFYIVKNSSCPHSPMVPASYLPENRTAERGGEGT